MLQNRLGIALFFAVLLLLAFFMWQQHSAKTRFVWDDTLTKNAYREDSPQPYGTQILDQLLSNLFPEKQYYRIKKSIAAELPGDSLLEISDNSNNYVFVGAAMFMDSLDTRRLIDFAAHGNHVFIAAKTIPYDLMFYLYDPECPDSPWEDFKSIGDSAIQVRLLVPEMFPADSQDFVFKYVKQNKTQRYKWQYIPETVCCAESGFKPLGRTGRDLVNFMEIPCGKGKVFLHANPVLFTNYFLLKETGKKYAAGVFSHLLEGNIYWDAYSKTAESVGRRRNEIGGGRRSQLSEKHPLIHILQQESLAWAWYLLLSMAILWLVFRGKRRQRVIPILPKNDNSSLAFIDAIAALHFRKGNLTNLCTKKMQLFLAHLRERYGIVVHLHPELAQPLAEQNTFEKLSRVSEIPEKQIREIFTRYAAIVQYEPDEHLMIDFHHAVEAFYQKAK